MTLECVHNNNIAVFVVLLCGRANGPARSPRAWAGPGPQLWQLCCRPGRAWTYFLRAGPGPHNSVCGPGPGRVCTTAAGPGRAWASNLICGPGLGLNFRPVQGPSAHGQWCTLSYTMGDYHRVPSRVAQWQWNICFHSASCVYCIWWLTVTICQFA